VTSILADQREDVG
jgi:hypothetical protein